MPESASLLKASIIIPTRGRDICLRRTLDSLNQQDIKNFDVWVVDQNDEPLKNLSKHINIVSLHHEKMPPLGSHAGRNFAIFKTPNPLCIFIDDDVYVPANFVRKHIEAHILHPNAGAIVGRVIQPKDAYTEAQMVHLSRLAQYNPWTGSVTGNFIGVLPGSIDHIHECNFSAKTKPLSEVGGFNQAFKGNAYFEGADLGLTLADHGYQVHYEPKLWLFHYQDGLGGNRVNNKADHTYWYMRNYGLLNSLHMKRIGFPIFVARSFAYVCGKALKNRSFKLVKNGLKGLVDGAKYFMPLAQRRIQNKETDHERQKERLTSRR